MKCPEPSIKEPCYFCYNGECYATHWWECSKGFKKPHEGKKGNKNNRYCKKGKAMNIQQLRAQIAALQDATMDENKNFRTAYDEGKFDALSAVDALLDSMQEELASTAYVVTRCEAHSDYVEEVFFDKDKAQEYCDQFKGNENEYARHITKIKVTL